MTKSILTVVRSSGNNKNKPENKVIEQYSCKHQWCDVINEVMRRKNNGQKADLFSEKEPKVRETNKQKSSLLLKKEHTAFVETKKLLTKGSLIRYKLGSKYGSAYFTKREVECMVWLLKGKTINGIAEILNLSPRTIESYIKNMKKKVNCHTKLELIDLVHASELMKNVDFL